MNCMGALVILRFYRIQMHTLHLQIYKLPIQRQPLVAVAHRGEVTQEIIVRDNHRGTTVVGMKTERWRLLDVLIQKEDDMVLRVVDKPKRTDTARFEPQIAQHTLGRSKREFARRGLSCRHKRGFQTLLEIVDSEVVIAVEANEVVLIALVVAHEDVFTMHTAVRPPPTTCLLDGLALGVRIASVGDSVRLQVLLHLRLPLTDDCMVAHGK